MTKQISIGWLVALAGIAVAFVLAVILLFTLTREPKYQDCEAWAQLDGMTTLEASQGCELMGIWGYDTKNITREEYEWNVREFSGDMDELEDRVYELESEDDW
jgi:hypothetical protein